MAQLYFNYGTMNSSKSAQLLMVHHNYVSQGKTVMVFKPKLDTRDGAYVKSRALEDKIPAFSIDSNEYDFMFNLVEKQKPDCVLVDEVQFLTTHQIDELGRIVDLLGIPVIGYGLMSDFQANLFPGSKRMIELGAKLTEIKTVCWYCDAKAVHNMRFYKGKPIFEGEQVMVGGNESYKPVCRACFNKAKSSSF